MVLHEILLLLLRMCIGQVNPLVWLNSQLVYTIKSSIGPSPTSGTQWQQMLGNWFRHVVSSHSELAQQQVAGGCMAFLGWDDGCDNWRISTLADACLWRRGRRLHSAVLIIALLASHFDHVAYICHTCFWWPIWGQDYDNACFCFIPDCDGALRGRARACPCMNIIQLVSARIRLGNFDWISSHLQFCCMRWTGRSQEANWADSAQAPSGASGTAIEDKRTAWVS